MAIFEGRESTPQTIMDKIRDPIAQRAELLKYFKGLLSVNEKYLQPMTEGLESISSIARGMGVELVPGNPLADENNRYGKIIDCLESGKEFVYRFKGRDLTLPATK